MVLLDRLTIRESNNKNGYYYLDGGVDCPKIGGNFYCWLSVIFALRNKRSYSSLECALFFRGDEIFFYSPLTFKYVYYDWVIPVSEASVLADRIEYEIHRL